MHLNNGNNARLVVPVITKRALLKVLYCKKCLVLGLHTSPLPSPKLKIPHSGREGAIWENNFCAC
jgi:hypothetical protein